METTTFGKKGVI